MSTSVPVEQWSPHMVADWVQSIGFSQYEKKFRENDIDGEVLLHCNAETLKELKIRSVGHRMTILKHIRKLRRQLGLNDSVDALSIMTDTSGPRESATYDQEYRKNLEEIIRDRDIFIDELFSQLKTLRDEFSSLRGQLGLYQPSEELKKSNTSVNRPSPKQKENINSEDSSPTNDEKSDTGSPKKDNGVIRVYGHKLDNHENEAYKTILVSVNDTCSKIIPVLLKKWKVNDDWMRYTMAMQYKGTEKCLTYADRPFFILTQILNEDPRDPPKFFLQSLRNRDSMVTGIKGPQKDVFRRESQSLNRSNTALTENRFKKGLAIYEFTSRTADELDLTIGDQPSILDQSNQDWWIVDINGKQGWVPAACIVDLNSKEVVNVDDEGIAMYDYTAGGVNETSLVKGERLRLTKKVLHWVYVQTDAKQGWVPACYVQFGASNEVAVADGNKLTRSDQVVNLKRLQKSSETIASQVRSSRSLPNFQDRESPSDDSLVRKSSKPPSQNRLLVEEQIPSPPSPTINKLDNLLGAFNEYLVNEKQQNINAKKQSSQSNLSPRQHKTKLAHVMNELADTLENWHRDNSPERSKFPTTDETRELANIISQVSPNNQNYPFILEKLQSVSQHVKSSESLKSNPNLISSTFGALADVVDILKEPSEPKKYPKPLINTTELPRKDIPLAKSASKEISAAMHPVPPKRKPSMSPGVSAVMNDTQSNLKPGNQSVEGGLPSSTTLSPTSIPSNSTPGNKNSPTRIIPYERLIARQDSDLDISRLEQYLSNEDCIKHLGCTKDELDKLPSWQVYNKKKKANLF